jgi:hypothetical protein
MADSIRAEAAQINPDQNVPQLKQVVGRVAAELKHVTDDQLAGEQLLPGGGGGGGGGSSSSSRCEQGQPAPVTPALALAAALVQLVLIVLEGEQMLHACMQACRHALSGCACIASGLAES